MTPLDPPITGAEGLRALLRERLDDVRDLDAAGFRRWLRRHLDRWERDPVFAQRCRIRDLRRAHPEIRALEAEVRRARDTAAPLPETLRLAEVERELAGVERAVVGLEGAAERAPPGREPALRAKLSAFRARDAALRSEREAIRRRVEAIRELAEVERRLAAARERLGLDAEEEHLRQLLAQRGRRSGGAGADFEREVDGVTRSRILPAVAAEAGAEAGELQLLHGVRLGAARVELDLVVVRRAGGESTPVEALAVVEAKRNINDLAHGLRQRRENLAWLTGEGEGYDPELYRTRAFRSGHFDLPAEHPEGGERFRFDAGSFGRFRTGAGGLLPDRLFLVTRDGPLWGLSTAALARVAHRVSTDEALRLDDEPTVERLLAWCRGLAGDLEAPDVLRAYADGAGVADRVLVVR